MRALQPPPRPAISVRASALTKLFGQTVALWNLDFEARSRELVAVHGANASGKTTLLRILAGLTAPTRGQVSWTTDRPGLRPRIGLVGHANHLFDELTALENVALAARLARRDDRAGLDLLDRLGLGHVAARPAADLSAGTRRRVGLARVLATDPDVLLADEPFAGLDEAAVGLVCDVLRMARDEGRLIAIATHDDSRTRTLATRAVWIDAGRLVPSERPAPRDRAAASSVGQ